MEELAQITKPYTGKDDGKTHIPLYADDMGDLKQILWDLFITPRNLIIIGMAWGLSLVIGKVIPDGWRRSYRRHVAPGLMLILCSTMVWVSGTRPDITAPGWRVSLGVVLAVVCMVVPLALNFFAEKYLPEKFVGAIKRILT